MYVFQIHFCPKLWWTQCFIISRHLLCLTRFTVNVYAITMHLLCIDRADWPKLHGKFKANDANTWQHEFPVRFLVEVCTLSSFYFNIFHDVVARIEGRCMIKAKHVLLDSYFVWFFTGKTALALKRSCNFSRAKSNELTDQKYMLFDRVYMNVQHLMSNRY